MINTLAIGLLATITTTTDRRAAGLRPRPSACPGQALLTGLAALPLVLPSFVSAYAIVLLLGRSGVVTQVSMPGASFGSIYGTRGIVAVYTLTLYPYVLLPTLAGFKAVDVSMEEAAQGLGSSPAPHVADGDPADRHPVDPVGRAAGVHRDPGEFRRAVRAGRGHADLRRREPSSCSSARPRPTPPRLAVLGVLLI